MLSLNDPLMHEVDLPLRTVAYPVGFPLDLATNSPHVLEAAGEAWSAYSPRFDRPPLQIRIVVQPEGRLADVQPVFRGQGDLYSIVFDRENYGVYERKSLAGYCFVSQATAANHLRLRMHFLEAMAYSLLAQSYAVPMHAAAVARGGSGFLFCGQSGAGKSTLSYACARAGWTFIADDATWLPADTDGRLAIGKPTHARFREDAPRHFPELAHYVAEQRPNGKLTIEAATAELSGIRTALHCRVDHLVAIERRAGSPGVLQPFDAGELLERILRDSASYGETVYRMYQRTMRALRSARAWRLEYETLAQALKLLDEIE